jgi:hypothetical protein
MISFTLLYQVLTSPLGRIVGVIGLVAFVLFSAWVALKVHDSAIRREALESFNKSQMELVLREQADQKKRWEAFEKNQAALFSKLEKQVGETQKTVDNVETYLSSPEASKSDRPSSDVLKETLRRLGAPK